MSKVVGIIPARYGSSRFPGKPLALISGKTLIQRSYENALKCKQLSKIIVATDDRRIFDHVLDFGGQVVMTSTACQNGTERLAEVIKNEKTISDAQIFINLQGDEPFVNPDIIKNVIEVLENHPAAEVSTAVTPFNSREQALDLSAVKCVFDKKGFALYFSRSLIPSGKTLNFQPEHIYYRHLGIYGYRRDFLLHYPELPPTPLQIAEDLEQLKILEHGYRIAVALVQGESLDVNTPADIEKIEKWLNESKSSLLKT